MKYEYARDDGVTCEIELPMQSEKPESIVLSEKGWKAAPKDADPGTVFRRVFCVPATRGVVPTNSRSKVRTYRNNSGTLNIPSHECPVSLSMPPTFERGEIKNMNGREVQVYKDGTMATVERDPDTGRRRGGYPILNNAGNADRWAKKLGVVNQAK